MARETRSESLNDPALKATRVCTYLDSFRSLTVTVPLLGRRSLLGTPPFVYSRSSERHLPLHLTGFFFEGVGRFRHEALTAKLVEM